MVWCSIGSTMNFSFNFLVTWHFHKLESRQRLGFCVLRFFLWQTIHLGLEKQTHCNSSVPLGVVNSTVPSSDHTCLPGGVCMTSHKIAVPRSPLKHCSHTSWDTNHKWECTFESRREREEEIETGGCVTVFMLHLEMLFAGERFNWERRGGRRQTSSAPGPASSSAAEHAPLCLTCWVGSVNGTEHCERWQKAAGPESKMEKQRSDVVKAEIGLM